MTTTASTNGPGTAAVSDKEALPAKAPSSPAEIRDPFELLDTLQDEFGRFWSHGWPFRGREGPLRRFVQPQGPIAWRPRIDVYEKDGTVTIKAELPGIKREDIQVSLDGDDLLLQGTRTAESEVKQEHYYHSERSYGGFFRRIPLPFTAMTDQIKATFSDGVLQVTVPRPAAAKTTPTTIAISGGS